MVKIILEKDGIQTTLLELSDTDISCLKNDLPGNAGINTWFKQAMKGKVNKTKKRLLKEWLPKIVADPSVVNVPRTEEDIISHIVSRDDYTPRNDS